MMKTVLTTIILTPAMNTTCVINHTTKTVTTLTDPTTEMPALIVNVSIMIVIKNMIVDTTVHVTMVIQTGTVSLETMDVHLATTGMVTTQTANVVAHHSHKWKGTY